MADKITVYINRNNLVQLALYEKPVGQTGYTLVDEGTVEKAVFRFGDFCVDTEADPDVISLSSTGQAVNLHLGLTPDLVANRKYTGRLTVYLTGEDNGIAWEDYIVQTETWPVCPAS